MTIRFACRCGKKLKTVDDKIGRKVLCPDCGSPVVVPEKNTSAVARLPDMKSAVVTSSTAGELLRQSSAASKRTQTEQELEKSQIQKEPWITRDQLRQILSIGIPAVVGLIVVCWGVYWLSNKVTGQTLEYPPLARVTGVVTLNGTPLKGATVEFRPVDRQVPDSGLKIASSQGKTNEKGEYELYYTKDLRGAYIGRHRVVIKKTDPNTAKEMIPRKYNRKSQEIADVENKRNEIHFDLTGQPPTTRKIKRSKRSNRRRR